jgi:uroporphyrinogen-III synthase
MAALDLSDVSVAITRPENRSVHLAARLENLGASVVIVPLIGTQLPDDEGQAFFSAWDDVRRFHWIAVTSATSVGIIKTVIDASPVPDSTRVAAVGASTARALQGIGIDVALVGDGSGGRSLAESMIQSAQPTSVLVVKAQEGRTELEDELERSDWEVVTVASYATRPVVLSDAEREDLLQREVIIVASPSAVTAYGDAIEGSKPRPDQSLVAIGKTTGDAADALGFPRVVVAAKPDDDGLVAALEKAVFGKW